MGFRFQKRIKLGKGIGLNISKSGISPSIRTKKGSISSKGYSIRKNWYSWINFQKTIFSVFKRRMFSSFFNSSFINLFFIEVVF
jgi:hypothetical protein